MVAYLIYYFQSTTYHMYSYLQLRDPAEEGESVPEDSRRDSHVSHLSDATHFSSFSTDYRDSVDSTHPSFGASSRHTDASESRYAPPPPRTPQEAINYLYFDLKKRRLNLKYEGDPDLQCIRTYEIPCLVRGLYRLSTRINELVSVMVS